MKLLDNRRSYTALGRSPTRTFVLCLLALLWPAVPAQAADETAATDAASIEQRLADAAEFLSSDEMEGRGIGSQGLDMAADYVAEEFKAVGLKTDLFDGGPFQSFSVQLGAEIGKDNRLVLQGPADEDGNTPEPIELTYGEDFTPISISGGGEFDLPLVFVGYGITAKKEKYDDYAGIDVKDKVVIILRREPQQSDPKSLFAGTKDSAYAPLRVKISNAFEHGAAGIILCTDEFYIAKRVRQRYAELQKALDELAAEHEQAKGADAATLEDIEARQRKLDELLKAVQLRSERLAAEYDPLLPFRATGSSSPRKGAPIVHCRREALDRMVTAALGTGLAEIEAEIDATGKPQSRELPGCRMIAKIDVERKQVEVRNVLAVLEGEGPLADETIVIGAHYDHVGRGSTGLLSRILSGGSKDSIYNGADDNASGTAAMIEIARSLNARPQKLGRRVVFIAFTAEERGLLGSAHYVNHPLFPLEDTVAMLNLDMVGRLRDDKLSIFGSGTAKRFDKLLDDMAAEHGFQLTKVPSGFGPSDHASFYGKKIPVMHFITGMHADVHKPSDTFDKLNVPGMRRVGQMIEDVAVAIAGDEKRPEYVSVPRRRMGPVAAGPRPYLGTMPDFANQENGYGISGVSEGSPAAKAGLKEGDAIVQFGKSKIGNIEDISNALSKHKAGDKVKITVRRGEESLTFEATLGKPR